MVAGSIQVGPMQLGQSSTPTAFDRAGGGGARSGALEQPDLPVAPIQSGRSSQGARRGPGPTSILETRLRTLIGPKVLVKLTDNRATMISFKRQRDVLYLRLHRSFALAPDSVLESVAAFAGASRWTRRRSMILQAFIDGAPVQRERLRKPKVEPQGLVHDLLVIYEALNQQYFDGGVRADITWSNPPRGKRRRTIRLGSYCDDLKLIRVHPALDKPFVPDFYVASVVFHEMLHQVHPVRTGPDGRRIVHPPEFREDEARFEHYDAARRWESKNLSKLMRV